jgi:hypothetical protein
VCGWDVVVFVVRPERPWRRSASSFRGDGRATHGEGLGGAMRGRIEGSESESEAPWFLPSDRRSESSGR